MSKKIKQKPASATKENVIKRIAVKQASAIKYGLLPVDSRFPAWMSNFTVQAVIVGILAFFCYVNTTKNEYALDDVAVIVKNNYVYEGLAGLPAIMTTDVFDSYYKQFNTGNQLSGGRYRPLSVATFAIEQQFFGAVPHAQVDSVVAHADEKGKQEEKLMHVMHIRHFMNVLWFTASIIVLLYFLRYIVFRGNPVMAFIATLIFAVHPLHTEVVANVKSRDEIMSLFFMCLTFIFAFKYNELQKKWLLVTALTCYALAFLSKEYAITMLILLPLASYIYENKDLKKSVITYIPYFILAGLYLVLRLSIIGKKDPNSVGDILNNPYAWATAGQKLATEISTAFNYFKLLIFPYPLCADYSYAQIPYVEFAHPMVLLSLVFHLGLIRAFFYYLKRKNVLSFAIAFYMLHLLLICNILFDIGATMGERLIYHSSVGFVIAAAYFLYLGIDKMMKKPDMAKTGVGILGAVLVTVVLVCSFITINRNEDWKNNFTLFSKDIKKAPNSVLVNANVASSYIDMSMRETDPAKKNEDLRNGIDLLHKTLSLYDSYVIGYFNLGLAYFKMEKMDSALVAFNKVKSYYPNYPNLPNFYYNIGVYYYVNKNVPLAVNLWNTTLQLQPGNVDAKHALQVINGGK